MKTLAIIAEYNPFHNGHKYHLEQARSISGADYAISLMSGSFLQRGQAAMWDKYTRAKMCVEAGIDLALELPFCYATGSAMDFANGAIAILNNLNSVDYLCFGAETDSMTDISRIADVILEEPDGYSRILKDRLADGMSYPSARESALTAYMNSSKISEIICSPNNILAIEYITALKKSSSSIKPILIPRRQAGYHDKVLYGSISSATAIRDIIEAHFCDSTKYDAVFTELKNELPEESINIICNGFTRTSPVFSQDLTPFLQSCLLSGTDCSHICDISADLANKILRLPSNISFEAAVMQLKSKNLTMSRVSRCLIHLLLGYTNTDRLDFIKNGYALYANILSFREDKSALIKNINLSGSIPLITKKADFEDCTSSLTASRHKSAMRMWELDTRATKLFNCLIFNRYGTQCRNDYNTPIPIVRS